MSRLGLNGKYGRRHGEELREERRTFAAEAAEALARASMAEVERRQTGETRRTKMRQEGEDRRTGLKEAGLGERLEERLGKEQEYARPEQEAKIKRLGALRGLREAEAEEISYSTEFKRGNRGTLEDILEAQRRQVGAGAREAELDILEMERDIRLRREAETEAQAGVKTEVKRPPITAKPGRTINPLLKKAWYLSPPGAALYGYKNIADWLGHGVKQGAEWAFPRTR